VGNNVREQQIQEQQQQQQLFGVSELKPVFRQAVALQGATAPLEHQSTTVKTLVDRTANTVATAKLKHASLKSTQALSTKVSANCPALYSEAVNSSAAVSTEATMLAAMQRLQKLNLSFNDMVPSTNKVSMDLQPLKIPGNFGTNISKQDQLRPDEPAWLAFAWRL
jgi:hypothetical protein